MSEHALIAGVGMIPFTKPGANPPYPEMAAAAVRAALADAGLGYEHVEQAYVGYVYGDSTCRPARAVRGGHDRHARWSTSTTTAPPARPRCSWRARRWQRRGADCALALGFEQMSPGALGANFPTGPAPSSASTTPPRRWSAMPRSRWRCATSAAPAWPTCSSTARRWTPLPRSAPRPAAMPPTTRWRCSARWSPTEEVMASPMLWPGVMTRLMACPPTCGAAAALVCSEAFAAAARADRRCASAPRR
jgi:hypothetical protein